MNEYMLIITQLVTQGLIAVWIADRLAFLAVGSSQELHPFRMMINALSCLVGAVLFICLEANVVARMPDRTSHDMSHLASRLALALGACFLVYRLLVTYRRAKTEEETLSTARKA